MARVAGILDDTSSALAVMQSSAVSVSADVHKISSDLDKWMKIIVGTLVGFGVVWVAMSLSSRRK